ncbi:hypothetical protein LCM20_16490 [Halobacillus litoralis]|uniref:hypothetical protein n=1 Tax=Halobacillus litoralis TaxID=45668 RepID=UPI001CD2DD8C|nr:hypothetical protein [Halobacillus litoralis]MCA0972208.1 hypothetical protein [Halobacillus litoralis]
MKRVITGIAVVVLTLVSSHYFLENSKKDQSYSTPEEALRHAENSEFEVLNIKDRKLYEDTAYVFFYSEIGDSPKNYLAAGIVNKNTYGWRVDEINGVGMIDKDNVGSSSGKDDFIVGFVSGEVADVKLGTLEADLIHLEERGVNAFLLHGVKPRLIEHTDFEYLDGEGHEVSY